MENILVVPGPFFKITYLKCNYFHRAAKQFALKGRNSYRTHWAAPRTAGSGAFFASYYGDSSAHAAWLLGHTEGCTAPCNFSTEQLGFPTSASPAAFLGGSCCWSVMQGSPRRHSAVSIFSNFFQGRRHSSSDPLLRIIQRRRSSVVEVLSSSTHRVMVAVSSLSPEELDATFPEKKSKVLFIKTGAVLVLHFLVLNQYTFVLLTVFYIYA